MKRLNYIWDKAVSVENGIRAVIEGTHKKRGDWEVQALLYTDDDVHPEHWRCIDPEKARAYIEPVCRTLKEGTYTHDPPRYKRQFCYSSSGGKWRDLYIPTLKDHIVHHMAMQASMPAFMKGMHPHCCGSVPERGIKHILKYVEKWMREDLECRYFVKLDIRKFFPSIELERMMGILEKKIKDKKMLDLMFMILKSAPECCPVGYYPSPWLANLYLEDFDWFVEQKLFKERRGKRIKYVRHFLRYSDDMLLMGTSKKDLEKAVHEIIKYLKEKKGLEIKNTWEIKAIGKHELIDGKWKMKPGTYWCDLGGYKFCKDATILRDGIYLKTKRTAKKMGKNGYYTVHQCQSINASVAWAQQADSVSFMENSILPYVNIKTTRRIISHVDKERKLRRGKAGRYYSDRKQSDHEPELQESGSDGGKRRALGV